ncbi:glycosyltransferase family 4 protein [Salinisphaera sp. P385]|uniref:Glycosyltransferase family 4 protein n=1 Tax=Spectribacter acetivorans TaxID=3075603 RepID=A0ABU3BCW7_9GAMM|nr:glycosyltransferase family 4 protein [Salinisphaera sp. P385]MDT0619865.1 glycosyltransferase family 4 protein [Salinisphaera sp. P385]
MPKLLYFVTVDSYFCSHRLPLAIAAQRDGYEVVVVTQVGEMGQRIREAGLKLIHLPCSRRSVNPFRELRLLARLIAIYRCERPDVVHHVAIKPVLYGSIAARLAGVRATVNAVTGLGYIFSSQSLLARALRPFVTAAFRRLLRRGRLIVQNHDDAAHFQRLGIGNQVVIRGSGVDPDVYRPGDGDNSHIVVLASRMLWDKGVGEFVEAAGLLRREGYEWRFVLVGSPDAQNRASISEAQLHEWSAAGLVEWWGHRTDMSALLAGAAVACLPSYREGLPKSLIEAAACALPVVTTDVPGCREIVRHGENGLLVPVRDAAALADALRELFDDAGMRRRMGRQGRARVEDSFSEQEVVRATLSIYKDALSES